MAKKQYNEIAVGITVLLVLALTVYIVVALSDWSNLFAAKQRITVRTSYREGLKGLMVGSPISLGGVKIGQITRAEIETPRGKLIEPNNIYVYFIMEIPACYQLRADCLLSPKTNVLGGQGELNIKDLGRNGRPLKDADTIDAVLEPGIAETIDAIKQDFNSTIPGSLMYHLKYEFDRHHADSLMASLNQTAQNLKHISLKMQHEITTDVDKQTLMAKLHGILDKLNTVTSRLNTQFDRNENDAAVAKLHRCLDKLESALTEINELVNTNKQPITETVTSLQNTAEMLEDNIPEITSQMKDSLTKANHAIQTAQLTLNQLQAFAASARGLMTVNRDNMNQIVANFHEISINLKSASREIRRAPWRLLYKPKKEELHIQGIIDSAGDFAAGAERLDNAVLRLKTLLKSAEQLPVEKVFIENITAELQSSFDKFQQAEEIFWNELEAK